MERSCSWTQIAQDFARRLGHPSDAWWWRYLSKEGQYLHLAERHFLPLERNWSLGNKPTATDEIHAAPSVVSSIATGIGPMRAQNWMVGHQLTRPIVLIS